MKTAFYAQLTQQLRAGLEGSTVYDLAVANTVATLGAQSKPMPQEESQQSPTEEPDRPNEQKN